MKKTFVPLVISMIWLALCPAASADSWTITLLPPSGAIFGSPGSTIGWGYSITNQSSNSLKLSNLSADLFLFATPNAGVFDFPIVAPNSTLSVSYLAGVIGLYELTWDPNAPIGFMNSGTFVLSAHWCGAAGCVAAPDQSALYSATVSPATVTPEPSSLLLLATGLAGAALRRKIRLHHR